MVLAEKVTVSKVNRPQQKKSGKLDGCKNVETETGDRYRYRTHEDLSEYQAWFYYDNGMYSHFSVEHFVFPPPFFGSFDN